MRPPVIVWPSALCVLGSALLVLGAASWEALAIEGDGSLVPWLVLGAGAIVQLLAAMIMPMSARWSTELCVMVTGGLGAGQRLVHQRDADIHGHRADATARGLGKNASVHASNHTVFQQRDVHAGEHLSYRFVASNANDVDRFGVFVFDHRVDTVHPRFEPGFGKGINDHTGEHLVFL